MGDPERAAIESATATQTPGGAPRMTDEILALLEEGPQAFAQLRAWLSAENDSLRHELRRLVAAGQIKRTGVDEKWALASYVAPNGRPPAQHGELDGSVLAVLAAGPMPSSRVATQLHRRKTAVIEALRRLEAAGQTRRIGAYNETAWVLASYTGPEPTRSASPRPRRRSKTATEAGLPRVRLNAETTITVTTDLAPSWWA